MSSSRDDPPARISGPPTGAADDRAAASTVTPVAGSDPDPRFTFANERTYLAWNRTALALIIGGLAVAQFLKAGPAGTQLIVALPLIALGAFLARRSYLQWQRNTRALRLVEPLPASALPRILAYGVVIFAVGAAALAIVRFVS